MSTSSSDEFDSDPFNFQPLKRRKNPTLKSQKAKSVKTTNHISSQKPTYVQKTLELKTDSEKPVEQQHVDCEGIKSSVMSDQSLETESCPVVDVRVLDGNVGQVCQGNSQLAQGDELLFNNNEMNTAPSEESQEAENPFEVIAEKDSQVFHHHHIEEKLIQMLGVGAECEDKSECSLHDGPA